MVKRLARASGFMLAAALALQPAVAQAPSISANDRATGAKAHPELLQEFGGAFTGPQADYVRRVGQKIAVQSGLSNAQSDFTVTLLNSPVENAFAIPGGYVYVTRNLLALMNDEAELASVMGHEVGHVAARHSQSRNQTSSIGGILAGVVGAVAGSSTLGSLLGRGAALGAQLYTLRFSRTQEYQADDLGIRYLTRAGYDPLAASTMLASLAAQNSLDSRLGGRSGGQPTMFSTHPDPASRVTRAANTARASGATRGVRNRDAFLAAIDGMVYGDDPEQGIVDGQVFRHPSLRLAFEAPTGFAMVNGTRAVTVSGSGARSQFSGGRLTGSLDGYIAQVFAAVAPNGGLERGGTRALTVNGITAATETARANTQSGPVDVTVTAYDFGGGTAYHFLTIAAAGAGNGALAPLVQSMRRLSATEAAQVRPRRVRVVTVGPRDTVESLAARMAYPSMQAERFRVLNAIPAGGTVRAGQKVKLIVLG